jgi:hypothetical protein
MLVVLSSCLRYGMSWIYLASAIGGGVFFSRRAGGWFSPHVP